MLWSTLAWVDINASVTPDSLALYRKLVEHPSPRYRNVALSVYSILLHKGTKTSAEKLQIVQVLDVMAFVGPLEEKTRLSGKAPADVEDEEVAFRVALGKVLAAYGTEALKMSEDVSSSRSMKHDHVAKAIDRDHRNRPTRHYDPRQKQCATEHYPCY